MPDPGMLEKYALVVFDADDTLRETTVPGKPCPHGPGEWVLRPGVREALREVRWGLPDGPRVGLASNQDQVAYGFLSLDMARRLLRDLAIAATGSAPDEAALQLCPHAADQRCACRKPEPGMLLDIMEHYSVGPHETIFVGNAGVDRDAAARAGVTFMWAADLFG
ncbi:MAG TPA: HAD-IIIA family hydrolase [Gemmatimonadales bacterium]|nr:HAD-IIIA family hydrolase [Gemmatimonadales bacterium]